MEWHTADFLDYGLLKQNAKANRRNMTDAERAFWNIAKESGLGQKCRRQYILGDYIVDFFFRSSMLIIEIDGGYHFTEEQHKEDVERQCWLENMGYTVLRFTNEQILCDIDNVISKIKLYLK